MDLTRRDALAALAALGAGSAAGGVLSGSVDPPRASTGRQRDLTEDAGAGGRTAADGEDGGASERVLRTLVAASEVVFPSDVSGHREFVETYVVGRLRDRPSYRAGLERTVSDLESTARDWYGDDFASLAPETRDRLLRDLGVDTAEPSPDGNVTDRVRFYVVNDLLFALYASPTGGSLVGIENPVGHPGGTESYQRAAPEPAEGTDE